MTPPQDPLATPGAQGAPRQGPSYATAAWDRLIGTEIERFRIETRLYTDRMRGTFSGSHIRLNFRVIVRVLNLEAATLLPSMVNLLVQEAQSTTNLRHPHVTRILACTIYERFLVLVNEFATGITLAERLAQPSALTEPEVLDIAQQATEGLRAGLQHGLFHKGVCPMHLRITTSLKVKLADYCWYIPRALFAGPAAQERASGPDRVASALLPYRAPEHLQDADLDHRADIYALGATLYHLLAGRPCFEAVHSAGLLATQRQTPPVPLNHANPAVSPSTSELVMAMLHPDRTRRPADYATILSRLESCRLNARLHQARTLLRESQRFYITPPNP